MSQSDDTEENVIRVRNTREQWIVAFLVLAFAVVIGRLVNATTTLLIMLGIILFTAIGLGFIEAAQKGRKR